MRKHRAVTLMEVLISIAVVAIGLLGVAALIPVAGHQTEQGVRNDRKSNAGRRALREMRVRGLLADPAELADWDTPAVPNVFSEFELFNGFGLKAFCVDPHGFVLAEQGQTDNNTKGVAAHNRFKTLGFPPGSTLPTLPRVTINNFVAFPGMPPIIGSAAEEVFVFQDDLEFGLPDDVKLPPQQEFLKTAGTPSKRYARGRFSWMLTLTPESGGYYTVSLVIFAERSKVVQPQTPEVVSPLIPGMSIQNVVVNGLIDVPIGNWIMLAQSLGTPPPLPPGIGTFRWYRVSSLATANNVTYLTLNGQLWDPPDFPPPQPLVYALIPSNVVAVYTRSIQLQ